MDFDRVISSAFSWVSINKVLWFIAFFWVSLPFIIVLPQYFQNSLVYSSSAKSMAIILYDVLYVTLILGVVMLIQTCLANKREKVSPVGVRKIIDMIFLVFVELFYVFVWNINVRLRKLQVLLIISTAVLWYLFFLSFDTVILVLFAWSLLGYSVLFIRNFVMLFFSTSVMFNRESTSLKGAVKESYSLTHNRVALTFSAIIISVFLAFMLFAVVALALGAVSSLILRFFFIDSIAFSLGFKVSMAFGLGIGLIAYHFMIAEVFSQLKGHRDASSSIRRILAHRVLNPRSHKSISPRRSFAKKKAAKKKR